MVANWKEISESGRILIEKGCAYFCNSRSRALSASYNGSELDETQLSVPASLNLAVVGT